MRRCIAFACWSACAVAFAVAPPAVLPEGVVLRGAEVGKSAKASATLRNFGDATIRVSRVRACCGASAELVPMTILPGGEAKLTVSLKPKLPGEISKSVHIHCDDPQSPVVVVPVTGTVAEARSADAASRFAFPATVALAGLVDGFNPCSFAVMVALAGILAIGGRRRRMRIAGGLSFCVGTFLTYMAAGLGLLQTLRAVEGLRTVHDVFMILLALALFALSFLSFRDAVRFRRIPVFSVVTLKLPEGVKDRILSIARSGWSGRAVVPTGFACGILVTLLDALCTGQVYVPVLSLVSRESGAGRQLALLLAYNLAFVVPLVAVFVFASKTTDAFQLAKWSSRNVIPAKIALGVMFLALGVLVSPRFGGRLADLMYPREYSAPPARLCTSSLPSLRLADS